MKPKTFMLIAGEASGDLLAAELVQALRFEMAKAPPVPTTDCQPLQTSLAPRFFGAGGPQMAAAGVELMFDMTEHAVVGLSEVLRNLLKFRRLFHQLYRSALYRQPDAIICIDFSGFNRRFAHAIKKHVRAHHGWFHPWNPRLVQYVSPQVWASREGRAYQMAQDFDLLLSIFPFEKEWYAARVPQFRVEFVGHPIVERYAGRARPRPTAGETSSPPLVVLLPGSRPTEVATHLPVMLPALKKLEAAIPGLRSQMVLPNDALAQQAKNFQPTGGLRVETGSLAAALAEADLTIACTGTVTMECACFGVPTVALYKTSWMNYQIAKRVVTVPHLAMPNLLAGEEIFPEFIQNDASADNLAKAGLELLRDSARRQRVQEKLGEIVRSLGAPGANRRAARSILALTGS